MTKTNIFNGFSEEAILFIRQLSVNNNKPWFETHRQTYETFVLQALKDLVLSLSDTMLAIDPLFETRPMINKTISRIYRDIRFSKDKSPFRTTFWITFKRPKKDWKDAPAYFFGVSPETYSYGMGFYSATPQTMTLFRSLVDKNVSDFEKVIAFYDKQATFVLEGDKYKRTLNKSLPEAIQEWYQRKSFYLVCNRTIDEHLFSPTLFKTLKTDFEMLSDLYQYLSKVKKYR